MFSLNRAQENRLLRTSLMNGEWVGGRDGSWMICGQTWLFSYPSAGPWETFSRCQSGIHTPSVTSSVAVLTLIREGVGRGWGWVGEEALSGLPPPPSPPASTPKQLDWVPSIVSYGNQSCEAPGGIALLSCIHFLPVRTAIGEGTF